MPIQICSHCKKFFLCNGNCCKKKDEEDSKNFIASQCLCLKCFIKFYAQGKDKKWIETWVNHDPCERKELII